MISLNKKKISNILLLQKLILFTLLSVSCDFQSDKMKENRILNKKYILYEDFPSKYVQPRNIEIYLPSGYDTLRVCPVLYMFDGQNIFHGKKGWMNNQYSHGWQVDETIDSLINTKLIPPMIIVGIFNIGEKRVSEYMPAKPKVEIEKRISSADKWTREGYRKWGISSDRFLKFLVYELKPHIDQNYKTDRGRNSTFLAGASMGGLISAYAISEYPNVFGGAACISTHWPALNGVFIEYLKNNLPNPNNHMVYFDYGTKGLDANYEPYQLKVDSLMINVGYEANKNWVTKKFEGEDHNENYWRKRFHHPLRFFFNDQNF